MYRWVNPFWGSAPGITSVVCLLPGMMHGDASLQLLPPTSLEGEGTEIQHCFFHGFTQEEFTAPGDE